MHAIATLIALGTSASLANATPNSGSGNGTCGDDLFWWEPKGCCLPQGGLSKSSTPPSGHRCMDDWYWSTEQKSCVPKLSTTPVTSCSEGANWKADTYSCVPNAAPLVYRHDSPTVSTTIATTTAVTIHETSSVPPVYHSSSASPPSPSNGSCPPSEFWWDKKCVCLPIGGIQTAPPPPTGTFCPSNWYWHTAYGFCVPKSQSPLNNSPSCPVNCSWIVESLWCKPFPTKESCSVGEFWWEPRRSCVHLHWPQTVSPPPGKTCPSKWRWGQSQRCCVPTSEKPPKPTCGLGKKWSLTSFCCLKSGLIGTIIDVIDWVF